MSSLADFEKIYTDLLGFFPPRMKSRIQREMRLDPEFVEKLETLRAHAVTPKALDVKTSQLVALGMLLVNLSDTGAKNHAVAALRAGATEAELHAVAEIAFLFRGLAAINLSEEVISHALETYQKQPKP
jgi:alkylhydroperoxidase/carboxymuconolactone decarboxylase family protein YurZ